MLRIYIPRNIYTHIYTFTGSSIFFKPLIEKQRERKNPVPQRGCLSQKHLWDQSRCGSALRAVEADLLLLMNPASRNCHAAVGLSGPFPEVGSGWPVQGQSNGICRVSRVHAVQCKYVQGLSGLLLPPCMKPLGDYCMQHEQTATMDGTRVPQRRYLMGLHK